MNKLKVRLERLERKIVVDYESYLKKLSDDELEREFRRRSIELGIDPDLPMEEIMCIAKEIIKSDPFIPVV